MSEKIQLREGKLVLISAGEYSDYAVLGLYKVLKDFEVDPKIDTEEYRSTYRFAEPYVKSGHLEKVPIEELWAVNSGRNEIVVKLIS